MYTLGINAAFHDPAACLVRDGSIVAAAEEERFTRIKHGKRPIPFSTYELPFHAIEYCLREAGIVLTDVDHIAYAFHASPFERAAVLTIDGRGERATTTYNLGEGSQLERLGQVNMPHSLGLLYERLTEYLGFLHSSDEYKVMALASFGKPAYVEEFRSLIHLGDCGQYTIDPLNLVERFGPARERGGPMEQRHYDLAHSLQVVLEETALELVRWLHEATGCEDLCMAGGVALN